MKGLDGLIRLQKFKVDEKQRVLTELRATRADLRSRAKDLEEEVEREKKLAVSGKYQQLYGAYAHGVIERRKNIQRSIGDLEAPINEVREALTELFQELKRYEIASERRKQEIALVEQRKEEAELNEIGQTLSRRNRSARL